MTKKSGFTLIELMIVMVIMGVLSAIGVTTFMSSQTKGRDIRRKGDLQAIAKGLELYYNDKGAYPVGSSGYISGCISGGVTVICNSANYTMGDGKTVYMARVPWDPSSSQRYYYVSDGKQFQLYAHLESTIYDQPITPAASGTTCGSGISCNYGVSSPNTNP